MSQLHKAQLQFSLLKVRYLDYNIIMRKVIIITGANSGLGLEFAKQLATSKNKADCEFWLIARNYEKLTEAKHNISCSTSEKQIKLFAMDISGKNGVAQFDSLLRKEKETAEFCIDMLINNAGFGTYGPFEETPLEKELNMIDLNCTSLTGICGLCLPFLQKGSRIINVSSLAAFLPLGNFAVYAATKAYVLSFSIALAAELRDKGIFVTALCPGSVSTNFANVASNGAREKVLHGKDPKKVVAHCLKKVSKGKTTAIWAPKWKMTAFISRFVSRYTGARYTYLFNKRPYKQ